MYSVLKTKKEIRKYSLGENQEMFCSLTPLFTLLLFQDNRRCNSFVCFHFYYKGQRKLVVLLDKAYTLDTIYIDRYENRARS